MKACNGKIKSIFKMKMIERWEYKLIKIGYVIKNSYVIILNRKIPRNENSEHVTILCCLRTSLDLIIHCYHGDYQKRENSASLSRSMVPLSYSYYLTMVQDMRKKEKRGFVFLSYILSHASERGALRVVIKTRIEWNVVGSL